MSFQTRKTSNLFGTQIKNILDLIQELSGPPIDSKGPYTIKVQKGTKNIVKVVHVTSVVQSECYEVTRILFEVKNKTKKTTLYINYVLLFCLCFGCAFMSIALLT